MFIICAVIFLAIVISLIRAEQGKPSVIACNSVSCRYNKLCRCTKRDIVVYDNTVKGLCLYHTENMKERILDPMREKRMIEGSGNSEFGTEMMDKIIKAQEEKLLKDPDTFSRWMSKVFRKRQARRKE